MSINRHIDNVMNLNVKSRLVHDERLRSYIVPERIIWKTESEKAKVENEDALLERGSGQISFGKIRSCTLTNNGERAGILIDFGVELQGGIQILVSDAGQNRDKATLRVRFGESAMEAMSEIGEHNATNNHAIRDQIIQVSFLGMTEIGNSGFRFARIDLVDEDSYAVIKGVRAVFIYKDLEYKGSFNCNDELLNKVWKTGAYTVHLNMQEYLWDGIKRDRLVWIGDLHPETSTVQAVFGYDNSIPWSLDLVRDDTPLPEWMNGIPSYSMWWILIHYDWYMHNGNISYLKEQREYLIPLLDYICGFIGDDGRNSITNRFIDWSTPGNDKAQDAGIHSLLILTMEAGSKLCSILEKPKLSDKYLNIVERLKQYIPEHGGSKQAAALTVLSGIADKTSTNDDMLSIGGAKGMSSFYGYYILKARAMAGDITGALDCIRQYWGGMLELGATTFWEDFNIDWMENAARIDEITPEGKVDIHGAYGSHCFVGYRNSFCHGWASGPTPWLTEYVLGVKVLEAGCKTIKITPQLGDLEWAEGTYPTPKGIIYIRHEKQIDGSIKSTINAPEGIAIIK